MLSYDPGFTPWPVKIEPWKLKPNAPQDGSRPRKQKRVEAVRLLYKLGADLNAAKDDGATPAHIASAKGHSKIVRALYELGADLDASTRGGATPGSIAIKKGHVHVLQVLHELGASVPTGKLEL